MSPSTEAKRYLQTCVPESVLETDQFRKHKQMIESVSQNILVLNANIYLLAKLIAFPFELLGVDHQPCWTTIQRALLDGCVLAIWRVALDTNPEGSTLLHIKNFLFLNLTDLKAKQFLAIEMKRLSPGAWESSWGSKIEEIRHSYIAHHNLQKRFASTSEEVAAQRLTFDEIKIARDEIIEVFDVLTLGVGYQTNPIEYDPKVIVPSQMDKRTDIEVLLDLMAKDSYLVNLPERNPQLWPHLLAGMTIKRREQLNAFRRKFSLPEV